MKDIFKTIAAMRAISACAPLCAFGKVPVEIPEVSAAFQQMGALLRRQCDEAGITEIVAFHYYDKEQRA